MVHEMSDERRPKVGDRVKYPCQSHFHIALVGDFGQDSIGGDYFSCGLVVGAPLRFYFCDRGKTWDFADEPAKPSSRILGSCGGVPRRFLVGLPLREV